MAAPANFKPLTSWSFSRYNLYKQCPARFKYKHLDKLPDPPSPAMARGDAIHKEAEAFVKGAVKKLPASLGQFALQFAELKKQKVKFVEESWAFTRTWGHTTWNDWAGCWLRVKLDVAYLVPAYNALVIIDHKTGKLRDEKNAEYEEQLELYGLAGLVQQPEIDVVSPRLWYLDHGVVYPNPEEREIEYTRKDEKELKKKWEAKVKPMFDDKTFKPKAQHGCQWCPYSKSKGGPCKY